MDLFPVSQGGTTLQHVREYVEDSTHLLDMQFSPTSAPEILSADSAGNMASADCFVSQEFLEAPAVCVAAVAILVLWRVDFVSPHLLLRREGLHAIDIGALDAVRERHGGG